MSNDKRPLLISTKNDPGFLERVSYHYGQTGWTTLSAVLNRPWFKMSSSFATVVVLSAPQSCNWILFIEFALHVRNISLLSRIKAYTINNIFTITQLKTDIETRDKPLDEYTSKLAKGNGMEFLRALQILGIRYSQ